MKNNFEIPTKKNIKSYDMKILLRKIDVWIPLTLTSDLLHSKNVFCRARHLGGHVFSFKHSLGVFLS